MDIREILAINLRKLRQARGLSQEELAHEQKLTAPISAHSSEASMRRVSMLSIGWRVAWVSRQPTFSLGRPQQAPSERLEGRPNS